MILHTLEWLAVILVTFVAVRAFDAQKLPELKPWHLLVPRGEWTAAQLTD